MERVSEFLAGQDGAAPRSKVEDGVEGKRDYLRTAMDVLIDEGYAKQEDGPRGAKLIEHVRHYREHEDSPEEGEESTSPRARPDLAPSLVSTPSRRDLAPRPAPTGGRGRGRGDGLAPPVRPERAPVPGDEGFRAFPNLMFEAGKITASERHERRLLHDVIVRSRTARA